MTKVPYDKDFDAWLQEQAALLRAKQWDALDVEHLAEEIEEVRKSERHAVRSHLRILLLHLLQWTAQPEERAWHSASWQASIDNSRILIQGFLEASPSLRPELPELAASAYPWARQRAVKEPQLPEVTFPDTCPWGLDQLLDEDFWPDG